MANIFFIFKSDTEFVAPTASALSNAIATNDAFNRDPRNSYSITAASLNTAADVLDTLDDSSSKALNRLAGFAGKAAPYLGRGLGSKIHFNGFSRNILSSTLYKSSCR